MTACVRFLGDATSQMEAQALRARRRGMDCQSYLAASTSRSPRGGKNRRGVLVTPAETEMILLCVRAKRFAPTNQNRKGTFVVPGKLKRVIQRDD